MRPIPLVSSASLTTSHNIWLNIHRIDTTPLQPNATAGFHTFASMHHPSPVISPRRRSSRHHFAVRYSIRSNPVTCLITSRIQRPDSPLVEPNDPLSHRSNPATWFFFTGQTQRPNFSPVEPGNLIPHKTRLKHPFCAFLTSSNPLRWIVMLQESVSIAFWAKNKIQLPSLVRSLMKLNSGTPPMTRNFTPSFEHYIIGVITDSLMSSCSILITRPFIISPPRRNSILVMIVRWSLSKCKLLSFSISLALNTRLPMHLVDTSPYFPSWMSKSLGSSIERGLPHLFWLPGSLLRSCWAVHIRQLPISISTMDTFSMPKSFVFPALRQGIFLYGKFMLAVSRATLVTIRLLRRSNVNFNGRA